MAVPPPSPAADTSAADKAAVRAALRTARSAYVATLGADGRHDALAAAAARALPRVPAGAVVALYRAFGDEIDPAPLGLALAAAGHRLALPHVGRADRRMRFLAWNPEAPLVKGPFGLHQPHDDSAAVTPDLIVTPLVGFDRAGGRIGQGGGFYDRAFAALPGAIRIGYAWTVQEVDRVPRDPWDAPLDGVVTEREWIKCTTTGR